jgi:general secretion pathway protein D
VNVLSTPEVLAVNNREARILVGSKVPFIASTRLGNDVAIDRAVQYQDVGTQLTLIPTINDDGYVSVQLLQEVSSLANQTVQAALNAPVITTREASTRAIVRDGQTVVIGGLIGTSTERVSSGVPLLKDIPGLGYLFRRETTAKSRTELAIFITPYIIRNDAEADALFERARQRTRDPEPGDARTLRRPATPPARKP